MTTIACLSPFTEEMVRGFAGQDDVTVLIAPEPPATEAVLEIVPKADVVIGDMRHKHRLDRAALSVMKSCRLVQQPAVGYDVIDHEAAAELGIPVANAAGFNSQSVADWTIMAMLNVIRHGARRDRVMRAGGWRNQERLGDRELGALTVGIVGAGNIGRGVARRLAGFGSRVLYTDVVPQTIDGARRVSMEELLRDSDVVTIHAPLGANTRQLVGERELAAMRKGAVLVNASRGPIVDEDALIRALQSGHLGGAALDVFVEEPLAADSPLRRMENVFMNPHCAGGTREARDNVIEVLTTNIQRVLSGQEPINVVNGVTVRS